LSMTTTRHCDRSTFLFNTAIAPHRYDPKKPAPPLMRSVLPDRCPASSRIAVVILSRSSATMGCIIEVLRFPKNISRRSKRQEAPLHDRPKYLEAVVPPYFLARPITSWVIRHRHIRDTFSAPQKFADKLIVKIKIIRLHFNAPRRLRAEYFVARLVLAGVVPVEPVGGLRDDVIAKPTQPIERLAPPRVALWRDARSHHHVRRTRENRQEQRGIIRRIIFQIRVLHEDDIAGRAPNAAFDGAALAEVALVDDRDDAREPSDDLARAIR